VRVVVVGGGSTYTPELVDGFARLRETFPLSELVLVDADPERAEVVAGVSRRILAVAGHPAEVRVEADPAVAADGATAVLLQLRVGGQETRIRDESWPLECGCIGQETTGAGGLAKALRTVPVVRDIARRVREVNPAAWLVDFTNPVGIVTRALLDDGHRAVGLCNVAIGFQRYFAGLVGVAPERIALDQVGLNHLSWTRGVRVLPEVPDGSRGEDVLGSLLEERGAEIAAHTRLDEELLRTLGAVPSYYLRYYYAHDRVVGELLTRPPRAAEVAEVERELLALYADPATTAKPALLSRRGGAFYSEAAVDLLASLVSDRGDVQVVNCRNGGTLPFLADDAVIEAPAVVGASGAAPVRQPPVGRELSGLIGAVDAYERLALEAATGGGRDRVVRALLAHPLVGQWDLATALADRLIAENRRFLGWA
jgi:6-phospho-beta-glucosidase